LEQPNRALRAWAGRIAGPTLGIRIVLTGPGLGSEMMIKLTQRHLLKGVREFELVDDHVNVRTKVPFGEEETLTVMLNVLDPEPVISKSCLDFNSRVNGESLISLFLGKPNTEEFNAFVSAIKERAREEFSSFAGIRSNRQSPMLGVGLGDEPTEFHDSDQVQSSRDRQNLDPERIHEAIMLLKQYLEPEEIAPFLQALEALKEDPSSEVLLTKAVNAFNELGPNQGAVLTYAPYVTVVLSGGPVDW
jgi:hypothetical protein